VSRTVVLFPLEAVAEHLAVSLAVVEQLVVERAFPVLRIGPERRVRLEDLQAYLRRVEE
jgi:excisionase family DNA binding protein